MNNTLKRWAVLSLGTAAMCMPAGMRAQTPVLRQSITRLYEQAEAHNATVASLRAAVANGLALITDLTDAANMKLEAELALANARIDALCSYYELKYASHDL